MPDRKPSTVDSDAERCSCPPEYLFTGGPHSATRRPVFPDLEGALPRFTVVGDSADPDRRHIYRLVYMQYPADAWVYCHERILDCQSTPTITCPDCGATSAHKVDIAEGYCGVCRCYTRIPRYAVLRFADPAAAPVGYEGRWVTRDQVHTYTPLRWEAAGAAVYERGSYGGYAEVYMVREHAVGAGR